MATKAQEFRANQQRATRPVKAKKPKRPRRDLVVDTSKPGVSATDRSAERGRNRNALAGRRGGASIEEDGSPQKPSRKSTRKSSDRTKRSTNQQLAAVRKTSSPSARAARNQAGRKKVRGKPARTARR